MYTANQLKNLSPVELQKLVDSLPKSTNPSKKILDKLNVGIYDKEGHLVDEKRRKTTK